MKYRTGDRVLIKTVAKMENDGLFVKVPDNIEIEIAGKEVIIEGMSADRNVYIAKHPEKKKMKVRFPIEYIEKKIVPRKLKPKQKKHNPEKPPLGLMPYIHYKRVSNKDRMRDIIDAMIRYSQKEKPIPLVWIEELTDRIDKIEYPLQGVD